MDIQTYCLKKRSKLKYGFYDKETGKTLTDAIYDHILLKSDGVYPVAKNNKWAILDAKTLRNRSSFVYDNLESFYKNVSVAKKNNLFGIINNKNQIIVDIIYQDLDLAYFSDKIHCSVKLNDFKIKFEFKNDKLQTNKNIIKAIFNR